VRSSGVRDVGRKLLFAEHSPLGYRIALSRSRWREIVRYKHPAVAHHLSDVRKCLVDPDIICASSKDAEVHLYYLKHQKGFICVVVGGDDPNDRFIVTVYFTRKIKKGQELWKR
jgi:hypothetical protein